MLTISMTHQEEEQVYQLAQQLTGNCQEGSYRKDIILANVMRRMSARKSGNLKSYLAIAYSDDIEMAHLLHALTIHTTEWFREGFHYPKFEKILEERFSPLKRKISLLSCACSTGEEMFSFASILETFRCKYVWFDYECYGFDIDPVSISTAKNSTYHSKHLRKIPEKYHSLFILHQNQETFSPHPNILARCRFFQDDLMKMKNLSKLEYDFIICRNTLIYFDAESIKKIMNKIISLLPQGGYFIAGQSDNIDSRNSCLKSLGNSVFEKI